MLLNSHDYEISKMEADLCCAFVDPTRLSIIYVLKEKPHSVTELTARLEVTQPTASRHLKILRDLNVVSTRRQGTTIIYRLADARFVEALDLLRDVLRDNAAVKSSALQETT